MGKLLRRQDRRSRRFYQASPPAGEWRAGVFFCYYIAVRTVTDLQTNISKQQEESPVSDVFDERRRALEEDYFKRKDKESLERLRAALKAEAEARGEESAHQMPCPRCGGALKEETFDEVRIDRCDTCHGIWLDAGELEQLSRHETPSGRWMSIFWPGSRGGSKGDENR